MYPNLTVKCAKKILASAILHFFYFYESTDCDYSTHTSGLYKTVAVAVNPKLPVLLLTCQKLLQEKVVAAVTANEDPNTGCSFSSCDRTRPPGHLDTVKHTPAKHGKLSAS